MNPTEAWPAEKRSAFIRRRTDRLTRRRSSRSPENFPLAGRVLHHPGRHLRTPPRPQSCRLALAVTRDGKKIDPKNLRKRLAKPTRVLVLALLAGPTEADEHYFGLKT